MASPDRLDLIIFGATGFTGRHAVKEFIGLMKERPSLSWGIAGRSKAKLEQLLKTQSEQSGQDLSKVSIVVADVNDDDSLRSMAAHARVVVNCVGPYRFFGEQVVKACIEGGAHHVDVSGEPQYMERMQLQYHTAAKEKGVYIVSACGFDSIPADLGVVFFSQKFKGQVNSVESYLTSWSDAPRKGAAIHYGTWESAVHGVAHHHELPDLRRKLYPEKLPQFKPTLKPRKPLHKSDVVNAWCLPFPGSDRSVVYRSQRYFYESEKKRPIQMRPYVQCGSLFSALMTVLVAGIFFVMTKFKLGRSLLLQHPKIFSFGFISHEGPSEEAMQSTKFKMTFDLLGWSEELSEPTDNHVSMPDRRIIGEVQGTNPGYGATCVALLLAGLTALDEADKMPERGGVYAPGAAFAKTSLVEKLCKHGFTFEVIKEEDLK
ncbi:saccharopine dehydrogenase-like oxidoreductase [Ischnura elegans]|uniref:saccharopine dehydrogenase-like oxidoreductase n=1 Tax=Ischnura elegans TaxID=197161 RepID=UPI001ED88689|nr:saccharopine dehydrogenase-like oxidoreductase [Ischnura elegans]XP_046401321.1 saccharopine dehydrogenase-like oxidoreductase [Ischnura elegans]